jgi:hypothetical protein
MTTKKKRKKRKQFELEGAASKARRNGIKGMCGGSGFMP